MNRNDLHDIFDENDHGNYSNDSLNYLSHLKVTETSKSMKIEETNRRTNRQTDRWTDQQTDSQCRLMRSVEREKMNKKLLFATWNNMRAAQRHYYVVSGTFALLKRFVRAWFNMWQSRFYYLGHRYTDSGYISCRSIHPSIHLSICRLRFLRNALRLFYLCFRPSVCPSIYLTRLAPKSIHADLVRDRRPAQEYQWNQ